MSTFSFAEAADEIVSADVVHRIAEDRVGAAYSAMRKLSVAWVSEALGPPTPADVLGVGWREHSVTDTHLGDLYTNGVMVAEIHLVRDVETHQPIRFTFPSIDGTHSLWILFIDGATPYPTSSGDLIRRTFGAAR